MSVGRGEVYSGGVTSEDADTTDWEDGEEEK
jgi:hypothetical protein